MATSIEWTDESWNPITGCTPVSAGCANCYARTLANGRLRKLYLTRAPVRKTAGASHDPFAVRLWPERFALPGRWRKRRRVFVCSMSDCFHPDVPESFIRDVFKVMLKANSHTFQVLTKRPDPARDFLERNRDLLNGGVLPSHIWLGTSIENQGVVERVDLLRSVPAAVRFLSCEPLLGPLTLDLDGIHWVIAGGESGPGHRPVEPEWVRAMRDQVKAAGLPFFFKQWGGRTPKAGGRELDGEYWDEFPDSDGASGDW